MLVLKNMILKMVLFGFTTEDPFAPTLPVIYNLGGTDGPTTPVTLVHRGNMKTYRFVIFRPRLDIIDLPFSPAIHTSLPGFQHLAVNG